MRAKLTCLMLLLAFMQMGFAALAQRVSLTKKNAAITEVFRELRKQSGYDFVINKAQIKASKPVTINVKDGQLKDVLDACFENQPFSYAIENKMIVVIPKKQEDKVTLVLKDIDVKGKVVDENGQPLQRATVKVKGALMVTITDKDGEFFLKGVPEDAVIMIAFLGYKPLELKAGESMGVINMELATSELEEVKVSTGYWTTTKRLSTGSIAKVTAKEIGNQPVVSPLLALQGRVAGLEITMPPNATPGIAPTIRIRGNNSLRMYTKGTTTGLEYDGNYPLYVIDGVPVSSEPITTFGGGSLTIGGYDPISAINPQNIESIEVLKDADATAIYGTRGANGVILITTKSNTDRNERTSLDVNIYKGIGQVARKLNVLDTEQYLSMRREAFANDGIKINSSIYDLSIWDQNRSTDWQDLLIGDKANIDDINAYLSGGGSLTTFRLGVGLHRETLVFPGDFGFRRISEQLSINNTSRNQKIKIGFTSSYGYENNSLFSGDLMSSALTLSPNAPKIYNDDGTLNWEIHDIGGYNSYTWNNPLSEQLKTIEANNFNLVTSANISYLLTKGLLVSASSGYTISKSSERALLPISSHPPSIYSQPLGIHNLSNNGRESWIIEPKLSYSTGNISHQLDIVVGTSWQKKKSDLIFMSGENYTSDAILNSLAGAERVRINVEESKEYKYTSIYGRIGYNLYGKYLINFTGRRDGSSRFGPENKFGNFGAIGGAWVFSKEKIILTEVPFLSFGKIRGSCGIMGSDAVRDYAFYNTYTILSGKTYQGATGYIPHALFNPDFAWESTKKLEAAIELGFFKDKVGVEFSWYKNRSSNQLIDYPLPTITGFTSILDNFNAIVENTGFEGSFRSNLINYPSFKWDISFNVTFPSNRLVRFDGIEDSPYASKYKVNEPLSIQWLYTYKGVNTTNGQYEFEDINGDNFINDLDRRLLNSTDRKYYGGLSSSIRHKKLELSILFQYSKQSGLRYLPFMPGTATNQSVQVLDRWFAKGDNVSIQKFSTGLLSDTYISFNRLKQSTFNLEDASFIRLKTLSLSYDILLKPSKNAILQSTKVFVQGQNLLTVTRYTGLDPETGAGLPPLRMISAGIQIKL